MSNNVKAAPKKENVLAGIIGALLFSLAGGICWFVLYQIGFLAGISGLVGIVCAITGYTIFAKKISIKGIIISALAAVLVMALAWYLCLCFDVYKAFKDSAPISFIDAVKIAPEFLKDGEVAGAYIKDLIIGLLLCIAGAFSFVKNVFKNIKQAKAAPEAPVEQPAEAPVEQPAEVPVEQPVKAPVEQPAEVPAEQPAEASVEQPDEVPVEQPAEASVEQPAE